MQDTDFARLTPDQDINELLHMLSDGLRHELGDRLIALHLTGSLTYGDFDRGSSDIDYLAVLDDPIDSDQRVGLKSLHTDIGTRFPEWAERIEGSYITRAMLTSTLPPETGRPYVNGGQFWDPDPPYGNEWLLNLYVLHECGIALVGLEPKELIPTVDIEDVREASKRDLLEDWALRIGDDELFADSHLQAYVTLTICRILHRAANDGVASKRVASTWVKETYGEPWRSLVAKAEQWSYGEDMASAADVQSFIRFTVQQLEE